MRIAELKKTMLFVKNVIKPSDIITHIKNLANVIRENAKRDPNRQQQPITDQKQALLAAIGSVSFTGLTLNEKNILAMFIDVQKLGELGVALINTIFAEHNLDPMGAANALDRIMGEFSSLRERAENTLKILEPFDLGTVDSDIEAGRAAIQITFKNKASIEDVVNFKQASEEWWSVMRGVSLLTKTAVEENRILSIQKGSPLIVELSALYLAAKVIGLIVDKSLTAADRYLEIKKKVEELKKLSLQNRQIEKDLDKEAENFRESIVKEIKAKVIEEIETDKKADGEVHNAMEISVKNVFNFLDNGGTVDCRVPGGNADEEAKKLNDMFEKIRKLETKVDGIKALPNPEDEQKEI